MAHRERFRYVLGTQHQGRDRFERSAEVVEIQPRDDQLLAGSSEIRRYVDEALIEELSLVDPYHDRSILNGVQ